MRSSLTSQATRRALLTAACISAPSFLPSRAAAVIKGLEDNSLQPFDSAPLTNLAMPSINVPGQQAVSLSNFFSRGQYVVLWIFPEDTLLPLERKNNELEARNFQKLKSEFDDLDCVVLGCTSQPLSRLRSAILGFSQAVSSAPHRLSAHAFESHLLAARSLCSRRGALYHS